MKNGSLTLERTQASGDPAAVAYLKFTSFLFYLPPVLIIFSLLSQISLNIKEEIQYSGEDSNLNEQKGGHPVKVIHIDR